MSGNRVGGYVTDVAQRAHNALKIVVNGDDAFVDLEGPFSLGFKPATALTSKRDFVRELQRVALVLAKQLPAKPVDPHTLQAWEEKELLRSLTLPYAASVERLIELRRHGASFRCVLGKDVVDNLRYNGFLEERGTEQPALLFVQRVQEAPVLWDMMCDDVQVELPDWEKFWGFRVPISHWITKSRTDQISLSRNRGFFSATHDQPGFAGEEVGLLVHQLKLGLRHRSLAEEFREHVRQELLVKFDGDAKEVDAWWTHCEPGGWLKGFLTELAEMEPAEDMRRLTTDLWKRRVLVNICKECFCSDLIHFACHAVAGKDSEFLSRLDVAVAGETVTLDVSLMLTDLNRRIHDRYEPGPLVFLNACGTGRQNDSHEPPGLPDKWILNRGALAVVATLCDVPDFFAYAFARKFYDLLLKSVLEPEHPDSSRNQYVAETFLATRRYFMEEHANPLGLAYVLYATPGARVVADFIQPGATA
jgi:hypothetical protein